MKENLSQGYMQKKKNYIKTDLANSKIKTILLMFFSVFLFLNSYSQTLYDAVTSERPNYCLTDSLDSKSIIGRQVKIWSAGGVYPTLNKSNNFNFPTEEIRQKSGKSGWGDYFPKEGDIGTVVHIFRNERKLRNIYLIKVGDNYVGIGCHYLTDTDLLDLTEEWKQKHIQDSIKNALYADGCKFKIRNVNGSWWRAGTTSVDKAAETFACNLILEEIDTILFFRYDDIILRDGSLLKIERAFVLWIDKGKGYLKSFFDNSQHDLVKNEIVSFESESLINFFFENHINTVKTSPTDTYSPFAISYTVQLYTPNYFYREHLTSVSIRQDKKHIKSIWLNLILEKLGNIKQK